MRVLVACEESQRVCTEFRKREHFAFSCDVLECSGGHPEWHINSDVLPILNGKCNFKTQDGTEWNLDTYWDLIIAHPPCTYLTVSGNRWFNVEKYGLKAIERKEKQKDAINFFMEFVNAKCGLIAIENPIGIMSSVYRKPDQIIQPYMFGDAVRKGTCLWLKNLPDLEPTKIIEPDIIKMKNGKTMSRVHYDSFSLPKAERSRVRSKTYPGIAQAMAEQWG